MIVWIGLYLNQISFHTTDALREFLQLRELQGAEILHGPPLSTHGMRHTLELWQSRTVTYFGTAAELFQACCLHR